MSQKHNPVAVLQGVASDGRTYTVAVRRHGPSWPLRRTATDWMCKCDLFWRTGSCPDVEAARRWDARKTTRVSHVPAEAAPAVDETPDA